MEFRMGMPRPVECDLDDAKRLVADYPRLQGVALLLGVCVVAPVTYVLWRMAFGPAGLFGVMDRSPGIFIGLSILTVLVHEFFHLVSLPGMGFKGDSVVGFDPKSFFPYVGYLGVVSKRRMMLVLIMPLLVLTGAPFLLAQVHVDWKWACAWVSMLNAGLASADIYMFCMVALKVPSDHVFHGEFYGKLKSGGLVQHPPRRLSQEGCRK